MYRSFRFVHPTHDAAQGEPGMRVDGSGQLEVVTGAAAIRQSILLLISTSPGERVMRPDYGCSLDHLMFAPNDETTAGIAIHYVCRALERWEPRIELLRATAEADPSHAEQLIITVEYVVRSSLVRDRLVYPLSLAGAR